MKSKCMLSSTFLLQALLVPSFYFSSGITKVAAFQSNPNIIQSRLCPSHKLLGVITTVESTRNIRNSNKNKNINKRQRYPLILLPMASQVMEEKVQVQTSASKTGSHEDVPKTMSEAIRVFFFSMDGLGPLIISLTLMSLASWRLTDLGPVTAVDLLAFFGTVIFWSFQEHVLHGKLLHSSFDWYGKDIHQGHHDKPYFHISIDPPTLMIVWMATVHLILRALFPLPVAISATLGYAAAGLFYEWAHYIVHTKVKPKNAFMKKMRDNHIRHHCVDHNYWLAFSIPAIDDIFGTNPDVQDIKRRNRKEARSSSSAAAAAATSDAMQRATK